MKRIDFGTKFAHGVGAMAFAAKDAAFVNFVPFFYTQVIGLSGTLYGWAALAGQISDALSDPIFGTLSDNHRSRRWGRRHPFMVGSILPLAFCFLLLFNPPAGWSGVKLCLYLAGVAIALRTFVTMFSIPHTALGAELSDDYEERSLIVSYRTMLGWLAGVALPALGLTFVFSRGADGGDGRLVATNYSAYAWMSFVVVVVAIAITAFFTRKQIPRLPVPATRRKLRWLDPFRDVLDALRNRNFRRIFSALLLLGVSTGVAVTLGYYTNTYFWEFSATQIGLILSSSVIGTTLAFAILRPLVTRFEKRSILLVSILIMIVNGIWFPSARLLDLLPPNGDPILFPLAVIFQMVMAGAVMTIQTMGASIVADVVDEHEVETGERREGVFFAAMGFSMKIPTGLGQLAGGILIDTIGIETGLQPGEVPADVLWNLGLVVGPLLALSYLAPTALLALYRLDRSRHAELRAILVERHSAEPTQDGDQDAS